MRVGIDDKFFKIDIRWDGETAMLRRGEEYVANIPGVIAITEERRDLPESEQVVLLLRLFRRDGSVRTLFLDTDPVQSNVREVAPHLERLDDVFDWLLEPGYMHRQGDVGIYAAAAIPADCRAVAAAEYADHFAPILSKRHALEPLEACEFHVGDGTYFVRVHGPARLVHPEHHAIAVAPGLYEIRGARGTPLPEIVGLRHGEQQVYGE